MAEKVLISYSRVDLEFAQELESALTDGVEVWRDEGELYGGVQWPKAIGEAIAWSDTLLLVWSAHASRSHFVEFEWTTAVALKKLIIPCLLDHTPLPPSLSAIHGIHCEDLRTALPEIARAINQHVGKIDPVRESKVLEKLSGVETSEPEEVLRKARAVFTQEGWVLGGSAYTARGNIIINQKSRTDILIGITVAAVAAVLIIVLAFNSGRRGTGNFSGNYAGDGLQNEKAQAGSYFRGFVLDEYGQPIDEARVEIKELPGQTSAIVGKTTSDGDFQISNIPAAIGTRCVVEASAPGYGSKRESTVLPGPQKIILKREGKRP
jgi:hypothetical protein